MGLSPFGGGGVGQHYTQGIGDGKYALTLLTGNVKARFFSQNALRLGTATTEVQYFTVLSCLIFMRNASSHF